MTSLKKLQNDFQKALLGGDLSILSQIPDSPKEKNDVLLGVYQYAYRARLQEFLTHDYPQLHGYLGDDQFSTLSLDYIGNNPSHHPNARWFGDNLPDFLAKTNPYSNQGQLHELAQLEKALNSVFDECEEQVLTLPQLGKIPPDQWPSLVFRPLKATKRLNFTTNAVELWNALVKEDIPPEVQHQSDPYPMLVYRDDFQSSFRSLPYDEAMMWDKMADGVPFGVLCELMAAYGGEDKAAMQAASYLHGWISAALILDTLNHGPTEA